MPEQTSITQVVQIGVESITGIGVAADQALQSLSISPGIKADIKKFRAMGRKYGAMAVMGKEWTEAKIEGMATYNEIVYLLCSVFGYAAPVQQGTTAAYLWTLNSSTSSPDSVKTFTIEQGNSARAHKFTSGLVTGLGMSYSRDEIKITGDMIGKALQDGITMTATPTAIALVPVLPTEVDVYLADTYAGLAGASALSKVTGVEWNVSDRFGPVWPLGTANSTGFAATIEKEPSCEVKMTMEADAEGMDLLTTMRAGAKKFLRIKAVGDTIESTYDYMLQQDFCLEITGVDEFKDEDGLYAIGWTFDLIHDDTWGKSHEFQVMNTLSAIGIWEGELLANPGFETGSAPNWGSWQETVGTGALEDETSLMHSGTKACKQTSGSTNNTLVLSENVTVVPGATYKFAFWTKGDGTYCGRYQLYDVTHSVALRPYLDTEVTGTTWTKIEFVYNIPAGCTQVRLDLRCPLTSGGIAYFDDCSITKKIVTASYVSRTAKTPAAVTWSEVRALGSNTLMAMTSTGTMISRTSGGNLWKSTNEAASWTQLSYNPGVSDAFPDTISAVQVTGSGHLVVFGQTNQKVYRSNSNAWDSGFSEVLTLEGAGTRVEPQYGSSVYGAMVFAGEYNGTDTTPRIYKSSDNGATWSKIYTVANATHLHHVAYDPYEDIIWAVTGDGTTLRNIYYSTDGGISFIRYRPAGKCSGQMVQIIPLPECVLFLTDMSPAGGWTLKRRTGLRGIYEELAMPWNLGTLSPVPLGSQPAIVYGTEAKAYFSMMYSDAAQSAIRPLVATRDGVTFTSISTPTDVPSGSGDGLFGIRCVFLYNNYLYGQYAKGAAGNYLFKVAEPAWS